ncbi:hypothetical protein [uncultured Tenacibaculum sp.]|uniref:hypothetical protein n=1 Tax=uncultured Tenacibaculum sp. TaxID=174713 RepID=UPI002625E5C7|nr:hypothetical protein [uncultured Tenacibaculum sp.]
MKNIIILFICLFTYNSHSQEEKESIYLFFDLKNNKKCIVEDGSGNKLSLNIYRKELKKDKVIFHICGEQFFLNKKTEIDTCNVKNIKNLNIKSLNYIKDKYQKENSFKHHVFKQINIVEKISETKIVKYLNVRWCCEWISED